MKAEKIIILALFVFLPLSGCRNNKEKSISTKTLQSGKIELTIHPESYDTIPEKVPLKIWNNTPDTIEFEAKYKIEKLAGNTWVPLEFSDEIAFIDILYILAPGQCKVYDIYLYPDIAEYQPGRYRVHKMIMENTGTTSHYAVFDITGK
ncbi:MAG: hypothetical protein LUG18_04240 [Candidatus Azobacteroides sp.]|nr:hypothetical protein [Candidatus Azobacteroides sp.]